MIQRKRTQFLKGLSSLLLLVLFSISAYGETLSASTTLSAAQLQAIRSASNEAERMIGDLRGYSVQLSEDGENFYATFAFGQPRPGERGNTVVGKLSVEVVVKKSDFSVIKAYFSR